MDFGALVYDPVWRNSSVAILKKRLNGCAGKSSGLHLGSNPTGTHVHAVSYCIYYQTPLYYILIHAPPHFFPCLLNFFFLSPPP
jgi:hypothetical protein